jgi:CHAT domain-containing protein/tetratricopeptide (TPR) repeat protein
MGKGFGTKKTSHQAYIKFLEKILQVTFNSKAKPQIVYPLLQANLDKLEDNFAQLLRSWGKTTLSKVALGQAQNIAATIGEFSNLVAKFPLGSVAGNLEIAIAGYEVIVTVFTREAFPSRWATTQSNLGATYCDRVLGNRAQNLEDAITAYKLALEVQTRQAFPQDWAMTQNNLGIAYRERIRGDRAQNREQAITACKCALQIYTKDEFPAQWAMTQTNLGNAYCERIRGDRTQNLEDAIAAYKSALQVYTQEAFPQDWSGANNNLGNAYQDRILGDRSQNLEDAIAAYNTALRVRTRETLPKQWADTKNNLGNTYQKRICGDREENLEDAIVAYKCALQVRTREALPQDWAITQNNLGNAYCKRIRDDRTHNLDNAIAACKSALQVWTREVFPQDWAITQNNLGMVYSHQGRVDEAIACFRSTLEIQKPATLTIECFTSGKNLGETAFIARRWKEAVEGYSVAIEAVETSRSWTTSESRRQEILAEAIDVYENMVQACINDGQLEKAIEYAERSRSKRLVDLMASNDLYQAGEIPPGVKELLQQYDALQNRIDQERSQNNSGNNRELMRVGTTTQSRAAFQAYNEAIASLEAEKQQIWERIRSEDPVLAGEIQVSAPDFSAMQKLIDQPTTAILSFYTTSNDTYIFVLRQNQITLHTCRGQGTETLQSWIFQNWLKPYIEDGKTWKSQIGVFLSELAQRLQINDLISQHLGDITELILVPHLALHQIPLAALPIGNGEYLGDKFLIRYTPSCQVLEFCKERGEVAAPLTYGIIEDATEDLPFASFEGEQIAQLYNIPESDRLKGRSQCTKSNYRQLASRIQGLHSCHHAQSRLDEPLESILQLAGETITLGELLTPGWRLRNLSDVFLSCCETGLGVPESLTDDILTLSTGFLCAGARNVVSSLWSVDDIATALFSIFYYQHRYQGKSRPEALRQAQIELRQLNKEELLNREDIKELSRQAEAGEKKAMRQRKQYLPGSMERLKWEREYSKYAKVTKQIHGVKNYSNEKPFSHPWYWAAFTCSGLR